VCSGVLVVGVCFAFFIYVLLLQFVLLPVSSGRAACYCRLLIIGQFDDWVLGVRLTAPRKTFPAVRSLASWFQHRWQEM
jgi:hypothetical protein